MPDSLSASLAQVATSPVAAAVATNLGTTAASGDATVMGLAALLNVLAQPIKQARWFHQNTWMIPTLLVLALLLSLVIVEDWRQAVLKAGMACWQAVINYGGLGPKGVGLLRQGTE